MRFLTALESQISVNVSENSFSILIIHFFYTISKPLPLFPRPRFFHYRQSLAIFSGNWMINAPRPRMVSRIPLQRISSTNVSWPSVCNVNSLPTTLKIAPPRIILGHCHKCESTLSVIIIWNFIDSNCSCLRWPQILPNNNKIISKWYNNNKW